MNGNEINDNEYWEQEEKQTVALVKSLPSNYKELTLQQVRAFLVTLSPESKAVWGNVIGKNPILRRVIYYVFSPAESTKIRFQIILTMGGDNFVRDMEYIYFALEQPEIRDNVTLGSFLMRMKEDWLRILIADTMKLEGSEQDIIELRTNAIVREGGKLIINLPDSQMEITRNKINVYLLKDRSDTAQFFTIDDILIRQIQEYQFSELRNETFTDCFKVFVYNLNGQLIPPPEGYINPFEFSLLERYQGMIIKEGKRHSDFVFGDTIESEGIPGEKNKELESIFYEAVMSTKSGKPSYIKQVFKGKVNDVYDQRSMELEEKETKEIDGKIIRTFKRKRRPFQERENSIDDMMSEHTKDAENDDRTPTLLSKMQPTAELPKTPFDIITTKEEEKKKKNILKCMRQDDRLTKILKLETPLSKKDQKYVERKRDALKKDFSD